jgi:putative N6-adenine-specific DNA methylase
VKLFAVVPPGLEELAVDELLELGIRGTPVEGGVEFEGELPAVHLVHLHARLPSRVLVRMGFARAAQLGSLGDGVRALGWKKFIHPRQPIEVHVSSENSRIKRREMVTSKVLYAIGDALKGARPTGRPPKTPAGVWIRIVNDRAEISIDATGEHMHRRGWATHRMEAPLRENLAAAVLRASGWLPGQPLVDPMCGSGTILLEAATIVAGRAPGGQRSFAFETWPSNDASAWAKHKADVRPLGVSALFYGSDRDAKAIEATRSNAKRAKVDLKLAVHDIGELRPPTTEPGWVVCNPPYGERLSRGAVRGTLERFGKTLRDHFSGWGVAVVLPAQLVSQTHLELETVLRFRNGGLKVVCAAGVVP